MPLISLGVSFGGQPNPHELPAEAGVAPAFLRIEEGVGSPGGITRADIADGDIRRVSDFEFGAEVPA